MKFIKKNLLQMVGITILIATVIFVGCEPEPLPDPSNSSSSSSSSDPDSTSNPGSTNTGGTSNPGSTGNPGSSAVENGIDYSKLVINEVNGVKNEKWFEIYNTGDVAINLNGVNAYYKDNLTWTGTSTQTIAAKGYFQVTGLLTGLSANNVDAILTLRTPNGTLLDTYKKPAEVDTNSDGNYPALEDRAHARIPDGTGDWYYLDNKKGTPNATNGTSTTGFTKFGEESNPGGGSGNEGGNTGGGDTTIDYTSLKLNEVNGVKNEKWFEIYNTGNDTISLDGVKVYYDNGKGYTLTWTGTSSDIISAKGFFNTPKGDGTNLGTGLSANNLNVKLQLRAPDGTTVLDTYQKPDGVDTNSKGGNYPALEDRAHARIPDGTGDWYYLNNSTGTPGATNGTSTAGYTKFGYESGTTPPVVVVPTPVISNITRDPQSPTSANAVTVSATVTNAAIVTLKYRVGGGSTQNSISMTKTTGDNYTASTAIAAQPANTTISYSITATNSAGDTVISGDDSYTVGKVAGPVIKDISHNPTSPKSTETVTVTATVTNVTPATVTSVKLKYMVGSETKYLDMTASGSTYSINIPAQAAGSVVTYTITATNSEGTSCDESIPKTYEVAKDAVISAPVIDSIAIAPSAPTSADNTVTVSFTVTNAEPATISSVTLKYKVNGGSETSVSLTGSGMYYSYNIPKQTAGSTVTYWIIATNSAGKTTTSEEKSYTIAAVGGPSITNITLNPTAPTSNETVKVSATVTNVAPATITSVTFKYKVGSGSDNNLTTTTSGSTYTSSTIPKQTAGSTVTCTITATNSEGTITTETKTYTVTAAIVPYTNLVLNEVNGVVDNNKWFEIYNKGSVAINLEGVTAYYDNGTGYALTWTGTSSQTIAANGYLKVTPSTGLSANKPDVKLQLKAPDGTVLDTYQKPAGIDLTDNPYLSINNKVHARIPDGGSWYYTTNSTGTPGATNGTSTSSCYQFTNESTVPTFKLLILHVGAASSGAVSHTFVELYNNGETEINLEGFSLQYADAKKSGTDDTWNKIDLSGVIPKHRSFLILGTKSTMTTLSTDSRYVIPDNNGDIYDSTFKLNNDGYKVVIMSKGAKLDVVNPFTGGTGGGKVAGYVDMLGALNNYTPQGYEGTVFSKISAQKTARRVSLTDNNKNSTDFESLDWRKSESSGVLTTPTKQPKSSSYGEYTPSFN